MRARVPSTAACCFCLAFGAHAASASTVEPLGSNFEVTAAAGADGGLGGKRSIAGDGTNFLVVWRDERNSGTTLKDVYGARVAHDGTVLDTSGLPISTGAGDLQVTAIPSVAFDGTNYLVVWVGTVPPDNTVNEIYAARVSPAGQVLATDLKLTTGADPKPRPIDLSWNGESFLLVWRTTADAIRGLFVTPAGAPIGDAAGFTLGGGFYPSVAWNGTDHLACWHTNGSSNGWDIQAARINPKNGVAAPGAFVVADPPMNQDHCSVASDGDGFLVAWHDWRPDGNEFLSSAYAARVAGGGTVLDSTPIPIGTRVRGQTATPVSFDGTNYLVVWMEDFSPARARVSDLFGRRVSPAGAILDTDPIPIANAYGHQFGPTLGYDAGFYLVAWNESLSGFLDADRCPGNCVWAQLLEFVDGGQPYAPPVRALATSGASAEGTSEWTPVASGASSEVALNRIGGSDSSHAYAATGVATGSNNPLLRWDGSSWSPWLTGPFKGRQFGQWVSGPDDVWTIGWCGDRYHYDGVTLEESGCGLAAIGTAIWVDELGRLFEAGVDGNFRLYDGIGSWYAPTGTKLALWDLWGSSSTDALAVGEFGTVLRWNGSGWSPESADVPTHHSLNAVWGSAPNDLFAVGDAGVVLHYADSAWTRQASGTTEHLFGVWGSGPTDVWAVGFGGTILHYDGASWSPSASGTTEELLSIGRAGVNLWVGGDAGLILRRWVGLFSDGFESQNACAWSAAPGGPACS